ncbi:hypothetical protein POV27_18600 [Aureisphaera galaxeae]|uniref:hypothetical protein n=1 Tax=Aureisphaera galaxeae TaxID=1538023 RepID=UPI00234FF2D3|nr:hypothetical protein [Aureisphaera galaxeae]MDC8006069.1 hypothetical protein [Aureisphaera galaxeae]
MELIDLAYITNVLQLIAAIVATFHYKKYAFSHEKYFVFFLWFTVLVDAVGALLADVFGIVNAWVYNSFIIISFLFYFNWYYNILKRPNFKKVVMPFTIIFVIVALISLFTESWKEYHTYTFFTGAVFLLVLTIFHFYQLLNSNEVLIVKYKLSFWISTALLLFYMGMVPLIFLIEYTGIEYLSYFIILISLNLILYGCYIIGFLWTKKEYNRF